jgi:hypothetical protein
MGTIDLPFETVSTALTKIETEIDNQRAAVHIIVQGEVQFGMVDHIEFIHKEIII